MLAAKAFGATSVTITHVRQHNLTLAKKMGADKTLCHARAASPQELADQLQTMLAPAGPEIILDCVGVESTLQCAALSCAPGGRIVLVGMAQNMVNVPVDRIAVRELELVGSFAYTNTVRRADACMHPRHSMCFLHRAAAWHFHITACASAQSFCMVMLYSQSFEPECITSLRQRLYDSSHLTALQD